MFSRGVSSATLMNTSHLLRLIRQRLCVSFGCHRSDLHTSFVSAKNSTLQNHALANMDVGFSNRVEARRHA